MIILSLFVVIIITLGSCVVVTSYYVIWHDAEATETYTGRCSAAWLLRKLISRSYL